MKWILVVVILWLLVVISSKDSKNRKLIKENDRLNGELQGIHYAYTLWRDRAMQYIRDNQQLHSALEFYQRPDIKGEIEINEDVKEAVKFAMIQSHPDKNNCKTSDEFIKFRELYNKLK